MKKANASLENRKLAIQCTDSNEQLINRVFLWNAFPALEERTGNFVVLRAARRTVSIIYDATKRDTLCVF